MKALREKLGQKRFFIPLIIILVAVIGALAWWLVASKNTNPEDESEAADKIISAEIANNYNGEIDETAFMKLLDEDKVEKVYYQYRQKGIRTAILYYIKVRGEEGYYQIQTLGDPGYTINTAQGALNIPLNKYLNQASRLFYGRDIPFKYLTVPPKIPIDKSTIIFLIILFSILMIVSVLGARLFMGANIGGFGRARTQDMNKPVYFPDVGGVDEALEEIKEVAELIKLKWEGGGKNGKR